VVDELGWSASVAFINQELNYRQHMRAIIWEGKIPIDAITARRFAIYINNHLIGDSIAKFHLRMIK
jgi:hypothetical protein